MGVSPVVIIGEPFPAPDMALGWASGALRLFEGVGNNNKFSAASSSRSSRRRPLWMSRDILYFADMRHYRCRLVSLAGRR